MSALRPFPKGGGVLFTSPETGTLPLLRIAATAGVCRHCSSQVPVIKRKARAARFQRNEVLRQNRRDPALERAARRNTCEGRPCQISSSSICKPVLTKCRVVVLCEDKTCQMKVPLDLVHKEWKLHLGKTHLQRVGLHSHIYQDIFGTLFMPQGFMQVVYRAGGRDGKEVHWGNIISAEEAGVPPTVTSLPKDFFSTLLLTNPDGHLLGNTKELLQWMIVNIQDGDPATGETVCPYLAPVPPRGTGFHRFVFTLYTHTTPLVSTELRSVRQEASWLEERTFSTQQFLAAHPIIKPYTFCFYQCQWDKSVHRTYMDTLVYPEPVYNLEKEVTPRTLKRAEVRKTRANKYRNMF